MKLKHIFEIIRAGELKAVSDAPSAQSDKVVVSHINLGLIELNKRFQFFYKEQIIDLEQGVTTYKLADDFLNIAGVYDGNGDLLGVNESGWLNSVYLINHKMLQVPFASDNEKLSVVYRATPQIREEHWDTDRGEFHLINSGWLEEDLPTEVGEFNCEVVLNDALLEPLGAYVAWRASIATLSTVPADAKTMYQFFEQSCTNVMMSGALTPEGVTGEKLFALERKGFDTPLKYKGL